MFHLIVKSVSYNIYAINVTILYSERFCHYFRLYTTYLPLPLMLTLL